jgi:RNA-dependent RNA polymerase
VTLAFKDHACLFSSDFNFNGLTVTPESIRSGLGDFSKIINYPALYGARMSQAFSSTDSSIFVPQSTIKQVPDLTDQTGDLKFSDGCGTISRELAEKVWHGMMEHTGRRRSPGAEATPCAFQIRIGGELAARSV